MVKSVASLYVICLNKVSEILMKIQRKVFISTSDNPFRAFPPTVLNDLIPNICERAKKEKFLKSSYLHLLLSSGRITYLKLTDVIILFEDAEEIFNYIQPYSEKLRFIKIDHLSCSNDQKSARMSSNFGTLLHSAKNLLTLETSINFKISELSSCINLEKLAINFKITDRISSFLHVGEEIRYNHSLKVLKIEGFQDYPDFHLDIAEILQYCVEIVEIDCDVSRSLLHLHESQKATKYKLQTTSLGSRDSFPLPLMAVHIASLHCPDLRKVVASPADYFATEALSNFREITDLTLNAPHFLYDDFEGVRLLLENSHFGHNLKSLTLYYFREVDFSCIGSCCPNLKELWVEYISQYNSAFTTNSFQNLIYLYLENVTEQPCEKDSIVGILSRAISLEFLSIENASLLNDTALEAILKNAKAFSSLKYVSFQKCGLTIPGLKKLLQSMVSIQRFWYSSSILSSEDIERAGFKVSRGLHPLQMISAQESWT